MIKLISKKNKIAAEIICDIKNLKIGNIIEIYLTQMKMDMEEPFIHFQKKIEFIHQFVLQIK